LLILDILSTTLSPNIDYSTEPDRSDESNKHRPEEPTDQRSNQEIENRVETPEIPDETQTRLEESKEKSEESISKSEERTERIETPTEKPENFTERPEKYPETPEEPTETSEEPTETKEEPTENYIELTEIPEQSRNTNIIERTFESDNTVRFNETNEYEVTSIKPKYSVLSRSEETFTSEPFISTIKPLINNTPRYRIPPNTTFTIKKQEFTKDSKIYLDNNFQEVTGKHDANLFSI